MQKKADSTSGVPITVEIPFPGEVLVAVGDILLRNAECVAGKRGVKNIARIWKQGDPCAATRFPRRGLSRDALSCLVKGCMPRQWVKYSPYEIVLIM